ncbi:MAG TPA: hypothetical protein VLA02_04475 [Reyranella sp.]|nr:hypothetical protein [Reyranella sp.]
MRSPLWFVVAAVIALASLAAAALYVMPRLRTLDEGTIRIVVPGSTVLALDKPGHYTIFHERRSRVDGRYYESRSVDGLRVTLLAEAGGAPITLVPPGMSSSYEIGGHEGVSILAFEIGQPGRFRLSASLANGAAEPKLVLAVSQRLIGGIFSLVLVTLGIAFTGLGLAGLLVLVVIWRRSKAVAKPTAGR